MTDKQSTHQEILNARIDFHQDKEAREMFMHLIKKTDDGSMSVMPSKQYHETDTYEFNGKKCPLLSRSVIKAIDANAEQWACGRKFMRKRTMDMGSLLDAAMLETLALHDFVFMDESIQNFQTKAARAIRDIAYEEGKMPILYKDQEVLFGTLAKTKSSKECQAMLKGATSCVAIFSMLEHAGFKALIDIVPSPSSKYGNGLCDLKRTSGFLPDKFRRIVLQMKYHWQAAVYLDLWNNWCILTGHPEHQRNKWYFLLVQDDYPYGVGVAELDEELIKEGREQYKSAIKKARFCLETGIYPNPYEGDHIVKIGFHKKTTIKKSP